MPTDELKITPVSQSKIKFWVVGMTPLICNSMTLKGMTDLAAGGQRKNAAERASTIKHDLIGEYRASVYRNLGDKVPTRLCFPAPAFKCAMMTAALDLPGAKRTEIGRLVWVDESSVNIHGVPQLLLSVVRSADINKTPDIRARAIIPLWCAEFTLTFIRPKVTPASLMNLVQASGILSGIGDFRQEKGKGSFGQFEVVEKGDKQFAEISKNGGRAAQDDGLENYRCYDDSTRRLLDAFNAEVARRGRVEPEAPKVKMTRQDKGATDQPKVRGNPLRDRASKYKTNGIDESDHL
jgi:hypothetical protein